MVIAASLKTVLGALIGIDTLAAEFNEELLKTHGLTSIGITSNGRIDAVDKFNEYRSYFKSLGINTGSFLKPGEFMQVTGAFEKAGIKLNDLTANTADLEAIMYLALNTSIQAGMSLAEVAHYEAEWLRELNLDLKLMNSVFYNVTKNFEEFGLPINTY